MENQKEQLEKIFSGIDKNKPVTIVSLISKQTQPNIIFIKAFKKFFNNDNNINYLFAYTTEYEDTKSNISDILKISEKSYYTEVSHVDFDYTSKKIKSVIESCINSDRTFIFNITGGTKIMSISLYSVARGYNSKNIFYIDSNDVYRINSQDRNFSFPNLQTLQEYFDSYKQGWKINTPEYDKELVYKLAYNFFTDNNSLKQVSDIREFSKQGKKDIKSIKNLNTVMKDYTKSINDILTKNILFTTKKTNVLSKDEIKFLGGGWFEEFVYYKIYEKINNADEIGINLAIKNPSNELDVCFVYKNILYIIECKTDFSEKVANDTSYKINTIQNKNGLFTKSFLIILNKNFSKLDNGAQEQIKKRYKDNNIKIILLNSTDEDIFTLITEDN